MNQQGCLNIFLGKTGGQEKIYKLQRGMRATSPSGSSEYVGKVAWDSELGYGIRAPEDNQIEES